MANSVDKYIIISPMATMGTVYAIHIIRPFLTNFGPSENDYSVGTMRGYGLEVRMVVEETSSILMMNKLVPKCGTV